MTEIAAYLAIATEALDEEVGAWSPTTPEAVVEFLAALHQFCGAVGVAVAMVGDQFSNELPIHPSVGASLEAAGNTMGSTPAFSGKRFDVEYIPIGRVSS